MRIVPGIFSTSPEKEWSAIVALHRIRLLAALFPGAVIGFQSAFKGGIPVDSGMIARRTAALVLLDERIEVELIDDAVGGADGMIGVDQLVERRRNQHKLMLVVGLKDHPAMRFFSHNLRHQNLCMPAHAPSSLSY